METKWSQANFFYHFLKRTRWSQLKNDQPLVHDAKFD